MLSCFSCVQLFMTPWTIVHQAPLSMGFSRQEYWTGLLCPPPVELPDSGIKSATLMSPALAGGFFTTSATWAALSRDVCRRACSVASVELPLLLLLLLHRFSHVRLCVTPETAAHQAPPSLGFSRQEHWSGLPFPSPMQESES